jgi:ribosome-associated protein
MHETLEAAHHRTESEGRRLTATERAIQLAVAAAEAASDKLADDIVAFDVSDRMAITDVFLVCSASNDRQVRSVVDAVEEQLRGLGARPVSREGEREGRWVLLDYVEIVVHVQHAEERVFYALERLWKDCPTIELPAEVNAGRGPRSGDVG